MAKQINKPMVTYGKFRLFFDCLEDDCRDNDIEILNKAEKPNFLFGEKTPDDFNMLDFGTYSDLCDALEEKDQFLIIDNIFKIIYPNIEPNRVSATNALAIFGFANWAIKEIGRINNIFSSIKVDYTDQEKKAGIDKLQFGTFGILDWYAKRMGIHDQNEVNKEKWVRIWQCMKNDSEETAYNRRLQKVYEAEAKHKH